MIVITPVGQIRARQSEWLVSTQITLLGLLLMLPLPIFGGPNFTWFAQHGTQFGWGVVFFVLGVARLVALYINGRRATITSWARIAASSIGALLLLLLVIGFALSGNVSTWMAVYPPIIISEVANVYFAAIDAGSAWRRDQVKRDHHANHIV